MCKCPNFSVSYSTRKPNEHYKQQNPKNAHIFVLDLQSVY